VLVGLLLAYAYPVRVYLAQQAEIAGLEQQQAEQRRRIEALAEERAKWDDPQFVVARARKDLHYILPGEKPYVPLPDPATAGQQQDKGPTGALPQDPWYGKLWSSVRAADRPGTA
jgi:hypothetical protein